MTIAMTIALRGSRSKNFKARDVMVDPPAMEVEDTVEEASIPPDRTRVTNPDNRRATEALDTAVGAGTVVTRAMSNVNNRVMVGMIQATIVPQDTAVVDQNMANVSNRAMVGRTQATVAPLDMVVGNQGMSNVKSRAMAAATVGASLGVTVVIVMSISVMTTLEAMVDAEVMAATMITNSRVATVVADTKG